MNSLAELIASVSALIAALSFAWIALTITGVVPYRIARFTMYHGVTNGPAGFEITHSGSVHVENEIITSR
jgi:hypothetical protein